VSSKSVKRISCESGANAIASRFSASAATYDGAARVQFETAGKLVDFLGAIPAPCNILDVGCGTGILTRMLVERFPEARVQALDIADNLLEIARIRFSDNKRVKCVRADAMSFKSTRKFQLIASSSSFHWMTPLEQLFANMRLLLAKDGLMAFAVMTRDTLEELHNSRARAVPSKASASRLPVAAELLKILSASGFDVLRQCEETTRVSYPTVTDFLYSIHSVGVTGGPVSSSGALLTRDELGRLIDDYVRNYSDEIGGVFASYHVLYAVCTASNPASMKPRKRKLRY